MPPVQPSQRLLTTIAAWKSKLLDLSKRNRALNFKVNKVSTVTVIDELPTEIYRLLWREKQSLTFRPSDSAVPGVESNGSESDSLFETTDPAAEIETVQVSLFRPYEPASLAAKFVDTVLQTNATAENLDRSLRRIDEQARTILEEQGVNALFLALGMLHYYENKDSEICFKAPLILVPVELVRRTAREGFKVKMTDEEVIVNPSLVEHMKRDFSVILPEIQSDENYEIKQFFEQVTEAIEQQPRWEVTNEIYLSLFSFQKLVMYKDLEKNTDKVAGHRIFQQMIDKDGPTFIGLPEAIAKLSLDKYFAPEDCLQVVDADSSQLRAIATVAQSYDLCLEGPPGTGKSQTITNLIAHALSTGKSVLFVAEKMAALEVVYRRLCQVGLGEFCLELHSTKANKRAVMEELKKTLDASLQRVEPSLVATARLPVVREYLTAHTNAVHSPYGALGVSPFVGFGEFDAVRTATKLLFERDITEVAKDDLDTVARDLADLVTAAEPIGSPNNHPWRGARKTFYSESNLDSVQQTGEQIVSKITALTEQARELEDLLGVLKLRTLADLDVASEVAETIARSPGAPLQVLANEAWNSPPPEATALIEQGRKLRSTKRQIVDRYKETVFDIDPTDEVAYVEKKSEGIFSFLAILDGRYRAIRRRWMSLRKSDESFSLIDQAIDMRGVADYISRRSEFADQYARGTDYFGSLWQGELSNWDALDRYVEWVVDFRRVYIGRGLREQAIATASQRSPDIGIIQTLRLQATEIVGLLGEFTKLVGWSDDFFQAGQLEEIKERVSEIVKNLALAHKWAAYESVRQRVERSFASETLDWISSGQIEVSELLPTFKRSFYQKWLTSAVQERPELREFHTLTHQERVREFRQLDELVLAQNRMRLIGQMRGEVQAALQQSPVREQMLTLRTQLNRQRGLLPLRTTMLNCMDAVRAIKPCFMMSPQSVAQLLDAGKASFDLIIFDEASQLPTEDAVGAVFRGNQLVVVGDPKQLPPTNFFAVTSGQVNVQMDEDGLPLFDDSQSILEEVMSSGVPSSRLKWHYRSSHESLITFSNSTFYGSDLYTFPSVESEAYDSGLQFEFVPDGVYEGKGLNIVEARRVADSVVDEIKRNPNVSLAVGTFNLRQQTAIQDELEQRRRDHPEIEQFFDRSRTDYFFVKNLENIQGDERDVIFISVTYAKARDGVLRYNLGPLNGENGGRRMNVLVTRARKLMRVFSSIRAEDINVAATASKGAKLLRDFLMYAEHKRLDNPIVSARAEVESPFESEVFEELTSRGLDLIPQVGASGYRIDFGVVDTEVPGRFVCGIECDGYSYHRSETARDRDRLRQQVLEGRGWDIHRIWSTDWFKDRNGQIVRILELVERSRTDAKRETDLQREQANSARAQAEDEARQFLEELDAIDISAVFDRSGPNGYVRPVAEEYDFARIEIGNHFGSLLYATNQQLAKVLLTIVEVEGPIHIKDVCTRAAGVWGQKAGKNISQKILNVLNIVEQARHIKFEGEFVAMSDAPIRVRSRAGTNIPADQIAPAEIREAVRLVLEHGHKFERAALVNEVRTVFGFNRTGGSLQIAIGSVIDEMLSAGVIGEGSTGIGLRS